MFSVLRKISAFAGSRRGLLKKSMLVAFLGAVFTAFQFWALMLTLEILVGGANLSIWPVIGVMLVSVVGRTACSYWSTNAETETGYFMVAEKRVHIGDRLRYIPMGYFKFKIILLRDFRFHLGFPHLGFRIENILVRPDVFFHCLTICNRLRGSRRFFNRSINLCFPFHIFFLFRHFRRFTLIPFQTVL